MKPALQWTEEYIIGVDEAGRGPLAGPVAVGVSFIPKSTSRAVFLKLKRAGLNDSKQVKEAGREILFEMISGLQKEGKLKYAVALVSADVISKKGIVFAIRTGIQKCFKKLDVKNGCHSRECDCHPRLSICHSRLSICHSRLSMCHSREGGNPAPKSGFKPGMTNTKNCILEMDGALKVPPGDWRKSSVIIKGDSIKPSIMIASIVAKVTRDSHMKRLVKKYPAYGFDVHKGYGTKRHKEALVVNGLCAEHRVGWCKVDK